MIINPGKHTRKRLVLTLLLFALLGLTTSIAIAWGATIEASAEVDFDHDGWRMPIIEYRAFMRIPAHAAPDPDDVPRKAKRRRVRTRRMR